MLGEVKKRKLCLRRGARNGDIIMVTGSFGGRSEERRVGKEC